MFSLDTIAPTLHEDAEEVISTNHKQACLRTTFHSGSTLNIVKESYVLQHRSVTAVTTSRSEYTIKRTRSYKKLVSDDEYTGIHMSE